MFKQILGLVILITVFTILPVYAGDLAMPSAVQVPQRTPSPAIELPNKSESPDTGVKNTLPAGTTTGVVATIPVGSSPRGIAANPNTNRIYVANGSNNVSVIDGVSQSVIANVAVGSNPSYQIGINPSTNRVYVPNNGSHSLSVIDGNTNAVIATVSGLGTYPEGVAVHPGRNQIYVAHAGYKLSVIDGATNTISSVINTGNWNHLVAINPSTDRAYVLRSDPNLVAVINLATNQKLTDISAVGHSDVNTSTNRVYLAHFSSPLVTVVDGATNSVVATISKGGTGGLVAVNSATNCIYAANQSQNTVSIIDGTTNQVVGSVAVGTKPIGIAVNSVTGLVYVANNGSSNVSVIQDDTCSGPRYYTISGHVTHADGNPISDVTISDGAGHGALTDASGNFTVGGLVAGTYTLTPSKGGYTFSPASRTVTVPPDATGQDFVGRAAVTSLVYTGAQFLTPAEVIDEPDARISTGDHVHLSLPFTNNGNTAITDATIEVVGAPHSGSTAGTEIYDGSAWRINPASASLSLGTINPGETKWLDFWIYVINSDPTLRQSLSGQTWIDVQSLTGRWQIGINLSPISFSDTVIGNDDMEAGSCLHNPQNPSIQQYAQYAAGACVKNDRTSVSEVCRPRTPPNQTGDPDTPAQAVRNLVDRVKAEFSQAKRYERRTIDVRLLQNRGGVIGECRDYADLTTGLLRSLNLPARTVTTMLKEPGKSSCVGHAWSEAFLGTGEEPYWKQADSGWNKAINEQNAYEAVGFTVKEAWADKYPLSSASPWADKQYRCMAPCYQSPVDCAKCQQESNTSKPWFFPDLSCVDNVQSVYHNASIAAVYTPRTTGELLVNLESPISVMLGVPFAISTGVTNDTLTELTAITTTVATREYVDSTEELFEVAPSYQVLNKVGAGETITVTWIITPLVTGSGIPLRFSAESDDLFEFDEQPLVVNEPGTLPDLSLTGVCGLGNVSPGQQVNLTATILDENLQASSDPATVVTATVVATPTLQFSTTLTLPYCESCQAYQGAFTLPGTAPIGEYVVDFEAQHPNYESGYATSGFFVISPLAVFLSTSQSVVGVLDTITLTAQVQDRGVAVSKAGVSAEIITPGGTVTVPLTFDSVDSTYKLAVHPADLAGNLGGEVLAGAWEIQASATYQGGTGSDDGAFTVIVTYPLSEVVISKLEPGAELAWPHMGSGVDHYEIYRSTSPYLNPGGADSVKLTNIGPASAAGDELSFTDADAFAAPGTSYFYIVQPVDANGQFYPKSNRVGVFNFALTPGTAQ